MNVFIEEEEEAMISYTYWSRGKIGVNTKVGGNVSCINGVEVGVTSDNMLN